LRDQNQEAQKGWFVVDEHLRINFDQRMVEVDGNEVHLTKLEFDLLKYLAERPGMAVGRSDLIDNVWGYLIGEEIDESINDSAINSAISKLRAKIEPGSASTRYIHSVHGIGYRFKKI
jgi:two-component system KDP operon response regulator KdpE